MGFEWDLIDLKMLQIKKKETSHAKVFSNSKPSCLQPHVDIYIYI